MTVSGARQAATDCLVLFVPSAGLAASTHRNVSTNYWISEDVMQRVLRAFEWDGEPYRIYSDGYCEGVGPMVYLSKKNATNSRGLVNKHFTCSVSARALRGDIFKGFGLDVHVLDWRTSRKPYLITNVHL